MEEVKKPTPSIQESEQAQFQKNAETKRLREEDQAANQQRKQAAWENNPKAAEVPAPVSEPQAGAVKAEEGAPV